MNEKSAKLFTFWNQNRPIHTHICNSNTIYIYIHIKSFVKIIFLIASRPGGLKSSDIAEVGRGGGGSLWSDFLSSVTCKLCLGNTGFGR